MASRKYFDFFQNNGTIALLFKVGGDNLFNLLIFKNDQDEMDFTTVSTWIGDCSV